MCYGVAINRLLVEIAVHWFVMVGKELPFILVPKNPKGHVNEKTCEPVTNKHSGSTRARSDQWAMDMQNKLKSTLKGKISRIETFIANEETDSVEIKNKNTKRFILQAVGKIFDPLGLISPFTVRMKYLLQDLWKEEIQWDDPLPTHIEKEWKKWCEELSHLRSVKIPRLVLDCTLLEDDVEWHSFCDASKKAFGAAIYLRTKSRKGISVKLVTSKRGVAPFNCVILPRLELLGAVVSACKASKDLIVEKGPLTKIHSPRSFFGFDFVVFEGVEQKPPEERASDKLVRTAKAGSDVVQSGSPIFDDFFQHLRPYIGNNTANVVFQMVKRLWLIRIDH
ncbi:uncharacterized protein TNCV_209091 [Trichonephila clavipes]|uniref:Uncharacterized protein n=1 Tax=Trichonephila clavipes TaxID=2585209 RepID=A0A8X6T312_TRICX|nr:uncharacterized protein TNCV_209091 [Trichonephila clavipes]